MSSVAARVFRGCRSLLAPASRSTSSVVSSSRSVCAVTAGSVKKPAAKATPKPKLKSASPEKNISRSTEIFKATNVSPVLAQFLGTDETTRTDAIKEMWTDIKSDDPQDYFGKNMVANVVATVLPSVVHLILPSG